MSQPASGSGFGGIDGATSTTSSTNATQQQHQHQQQDDTQSRQNGRADIAADVVKSTDMSNGFEVRANRPPLPRPNDAQDQSAQTKSQVQAQNHQGHMADERPASVPVLLTHQPYHDNIVIDRLQFVSQAAAAHLGPEYVIAAPADSLQYSQLHGALYNSAQAQYVSRDPSFRDSGLYTQSVAIAAPQGTYVQQAPQTQPPGGQPPTFYAKQGIGLQPTVAAGYVHFGPQIHYSQYPQTVMNAAPYNPAKPMYPQPYGPQPGQQQTSSAQHSPNPQRYSQEMSGYQAQPIIQPIAQNVSVSADKPPRGPKPTVPPRVNSKITHETGHRKSASMDAGQTSLSKSSGKSDDNNQMTSQDSQQPTQDNQERRYVVTATQVPRTRQDGLYVEANGDVSRDQSVAGSDVEGSERAIYVSRPERRKSISADVPRRNDTITFTFPGETGAQAAESLLSANRKSLASANVSDVKPDVATSNFIEQQRRLDMNASMRMSPMPMLPQLSVAPKAILVGGERKSVEWSSLSPNQRIVVPQENRRSDYFEDHRRSPMMIDGKRLDEVRRSPMAFVPIRDGNAADRICQKSPNNLPNNVDKTRADLIMWAEQRQRQELESRMMQNREMYTTSPRSRAPSEERRPESRSYGQIDKESRLPIAVSAFQPIANITQNSILEQRRHLRHVSADLTKHMEAVSRKEFDDQHITGSVVNLGTTGSLTATTNAISRASPICYQYPALSEAKLDQAKVPLTIVTDFNEVPTKPFEQVDHIIHSHRKSQNLSSTEKNHHDGSQPNQSNASNNDKLDSQDIHVQQLFQNKQSIDFIAEKLSQCERQQSDLQAKLHSLQSQNEILDKVAQFSYQQSDFQHRMQNLHLQSHMAEKLSQNKSSEFSTASSRDQNSDQEQTNKSILNQCINASRQLYGQPLLTTVPQMQAAGYLSGSDSRVSPRMQQQQAQEDSDLSDSIQIPNISQMPLPSLSQFDRADVMSRTPFSQLQQRMQQHQQQNSDNLDSLPCSQTSLASIGGGSLNFTGTLKKVPPEKPPRTSLIVQSPDTESNRSQPAIGLKHTSKARLNIRNSSEIASSSISEGSPQRQPVTVNKIFTSKDVSRNPQPTARAHQRRREEADRISIL